jgi:hypothetical protein
MMEPDIRIKTNEQGFCLTHYNMMLGRRRMLGMGLMMESHLAEVEKYLKGPAILGDKRASAINALTRLEGDCYVCRRIQYNFEHMVETVVYLWDADPDFVPKLQAQPYFCLPHYRHLLQYGQKRLGKKKLSAFADDCEKIVMKYLSELTEDVSWFCKKFDYRYDEEPCYNSKDSVERAIKFLRSDIHVK